MPKIGEYQFPDFTLSEAIGITKIIYHDSITSLEGLATKLGHSNTRSGTFHMKLATLRSFGLISSAYGGKFALTQLGTNIAKPKDNEEYSHSLVEALEKVPLFGAIKKKLGSKTAGDDFWIVLHEVTGVDKRTAENETTRVRRLYMDSAKYLTNIPQSAADTASTSSPIQYSELPNISRTPSSDTIEIRDGNAYLRFTPDKKVISRLIKLLQAYSDEIDAGEPK